MSNKHPSRKPQKQQKDPEYVKAQRRLRDSALGGLEWHTSIFCDDSYPIGKTDWAYVTSTGKIYLNPHREASTAEWEYVIAHCMLHLGMGHFQANRLGDPLWQRACDLVVTRFLRESKIGQAPYDFIAALPFPIKSEEETLAQLRVLSDERLGPSFCTMNSGRPGMVWDGKPGRDYVRILADSFLDSMRETVRKAAGLPPEEVGNGRGSHAGKTAREWFISSYPLLGAVAANFRLIADKTALKRMGIEVAAISPQLGEIYINPEVDLSLEEWKFVLAHEFMHAALRHDARCEDRNPTLWNVACDFVINLWLQEMGVGERPAWVLYEERFSGMTAEAVYDVVCSDPRYYMKIALNDLLYGDPEWWDKLDGADLDEFYRNALQQGLEFHQRRGRGMLPANLVEEIYALSRPPIRWDVELARWFDEQFEPIERHRTYARMSRRQSSTPDIPRPAWHLEEQAVERRTYGVLLDTSGSMDRGLLAAALGSIASYSESRDVRHVRVVFCDAAAYDQGIMSPEEIAGKVRVRGRGGTVLQPGIDLLDQDEKFPKDAPLLIITDTGCEDHLNLRGRKHAYLIPYGERLPFQPKGPVFRLKGREEND